MKTVQEWLNELDIDLLIQDYLYIDPVKYDNHEEKLNKTVQEVMDEHIKNVRNFINRMRTIPVKVPEDGRQCILYARRTIEDGVPSQAFELVHKDELLEKGHEALDYAYYFSEQAEIAGYFVADTPLTLACIYDLIADVMNEASYFGYEQEYLEESIQRVKSAAQEVEEGTAVTHSANEVFADLCDESDTVSLYNDKDGWDLYHKILEAESEYMNYFRDKELDALIELLKKEG